MSNIIRVIKEKIIESIDSTPEKVSIFFKKGPGDYAEHDQFIGIKVPTLRRIAREFMSISLENLTYFLESKVNEERLFSLIILTQKYQLAESNLAREEIYSFYMNNLNYVNNWNLVDSSAHLILGAHIFRSKDHVILENLAKSDDLWRRRISIIATLYFIRNSELDLTFKIAKLLQNDPHDLIHKAVGWMLREAGKKDEVRLINFLTENKTKMPNMMLRYASERLAKTKF